MTEDQKNIAHIWTKGVANNINFMARMCVIIIAFDQSSRRL